MGFGYRVCRHPLALASIEQMNYPMSTMHLSFEITSKNKTDFLKYWAAKYVYPDEDKYFRNIGKPLTDQSRQELFEWKNGSRISRAKMTSIFKNYPLIFAGDHRSRYLNYKESGGAVWNIFYLHCLQPQTWPIFDQHTFRAMRYMKSGQIVDTSVSDRQKYEVYENEYIPFLREFDDDCNRQIDKALFAFGQFLKLAEKFVKPHISPIESAFVLPAIG